MNSCLIEIDLFAKTSKASLQIDLLRNGPCNRQPKCISMSARPNTITVATTVAQSVHISKATLFAGAYTHSP